MPGPGSPKDQKNSHRHQIVIGKISACLRPRPSLLGSLPWLPSPTYGKDPTHLRCWQGPHHLCPHLLSSPLLAPLQPHLPPCYPSNPPDISCLRAFAPAVPSVRCDPPPALGSLHISRTHLLQKAFLDWPPPRSASQLLTTDVHVPFTALSTAATLQLPGSFATYWPRGRLARGSM